MKPLHGVWVTPHTRFRLGSTLLTHERTTRLTPVLTLDFHDFFLEWPPEGVSG